MEKKTIGKFISALRKANGMTQRELGDKLFVSDKTVSRWERDECTPELSLIPSIAEIFGITTDELLRGERNNPHREGQNSESGEGRQSARADKQMRLMLENNKRRYKNLTLISVGITILGVIAAAIANLGFSKGLVAFCLCAAFCVVGEICQICFAVNGRIMSDEDNDSYADKITLSNTEMTKTAVGVSFFNIGVIGFCLPLVAVINGANYGLKFGSWLGFGAIFTACSLVLGYVCYSLLARNKLLEKELIVEDAKKREQNKEKRELLKKLTMISVAIALVICVGLIMLENYGPGVFTKKRVFDNCADFKAFMESDYDKWLEESHTYYDANGNKVTEIPIINGDGKGDGKVDEGYTLSKEYGEILNSDGEVICEYYYNPNLYRRITFTKTAEDKMPVTVVTNEAYYNGTDTYEIVETCLHLLLIIDFSAAAIVYLVKINKREK